MKLELKAKHFEGTFYVSCNGFCAIEKAYFELTGNACREGVDFLSTNGNRIDHEAYEVDEFDSDKLKAETHNWDDTVIRTIELIEG